MNRSSSINKKGYLINIVETGLKVWIRSQCKQIEDLNLDLENSVFEMLKCRISSARLSACNVNYKNLLINFVDLRSGKLEVNLRLGLTQQKVKINDDFRIHGNLSFLGDELQSTLLSKPWIWLGNWLSKELLGQDNFKGLNIINDRLFLKAGKPHSDKTVEDSFRIKADSGKILIKSTNNKKIQTFLPMDPLIEINQAILENNKLVISGRSRVII